MAPGMNWPTLVASFCQQQGLLSHRAKYHDSIHTNLHKLDDGITDIDDMPRGLDDMLQKMLVITRIVNEPN